MLNESLENGTFPYELEHAVVLPIFKSGGFEVISIKPSFTNLHFGAKNSQNVVVLQIQTFLKKYFFID